MTNTTTQQEEWFVYRESDTPGIKPEFLGMLVCPAGLPVEEAFERAWHKLGGDWPSEQMIIH